MKREELKNKIKSCKDERWISENHIEYYIEKDDVIYAKKDQFLAFLMGHSGDDMDDFYLSSCGTLKDGNDLMKFLNDLSEDVGAKVDIGAVKEKVVVEESKEQACEINKLRGEVSAYEKILSGSEIKILK